MPRKFHERFGIDLGVEEAKGRFVNRVLNFLLDQVLVSVDVHNGRNARTSLEQHICQKLGERFTGVGGLATILGQNFDKSLRAMEALYSHPNHKDTANAGVHAILAESEIDIGIRWQDGSFLPSGAPVLDQALIDDVLGLIQFAEFQGINQAFTKGLHHLLNSLSNRALLSDVVADMYEALEALGKIVCRNDKDLSTNREALVANLNLNDHYKKILKEYVEYANDFHRHAGDRGQAKPLPSHREVEGFMYLTGLIIRMALTK